MFKLIFEKARRFVESFLIFVFRRRDPLTGLPDRSALKNIHKKRFYKEEVSLIFLDLDNLKEINDCLGHQMGDIYLKEFADLLKREVRNRDFALRWGGDEFVVCLFNAGKNEAKSFLERIKMKTDCLDVTRREDYLRLKEESESRRLCCPDELKKVAASGGISEIKDDVFKAISVADIRMYEDKNQNKKLIYWNRKKLKNR